MNSFVYHEVGVSQVSGSDQRGPSTSFFQDVSQVYGQAVSTHHVSIEEEGSLMFMSIHLAPVNLHLLCRVI